MDRCFGCMEEKNTASAECPLCGYIRGTLPSEKYHMTPGVTLHGKYTVGKVLGYGGFGVTYLGWDLSLRRKVAIKEFFPAELAARSSNGLMVQVYQNTFDRFEAGLKRFVEEAQCLAQFNRVGSIVDVYEVFIENNTGYIVMEYLEGETVRELISKNGPFPYESARLVISDILKTLSEVHRAGILHRDISPDNIFITRDNKIKLLDFGAARYATDIHSERLDVILKPGYAPEEQYRKHGEQGSWSDVYAASATLYKMITGITPKEAIERLKHDTLQSPQELGVDIPVGANMAMMRALTVNAKRRTRTAEDFLWELERTRVVAPAASDAVLKEERKPVRQDKEKSGGGGIAVFLGVLALVLLAVILVVSLPDFSKTPPPTNDITEVNTDLVLSYTTDFDNEEKTIAFTEKIDLDFSDTAYRSNTPLENVNSVSLKLEDANDLQEGISTTVMVGETEIFPDENGVYVIPVTTKLTVTVTNVYFKENVFTKLKFLKKLFQKSSTYTFECSPKSVAKLSEVSYSIDGGEWIPIDMGNATIDEGIPYTADFVRIMAEGEQEWFTIGYDPDNVIPVKAYEEFTNIIHVTLHVNDPTGEYDEGTYTVTLFVEPAPISTPTPTPTPTATPKPTPTRTPKPLATPTQNPTLTPAETSTPTPDLPSPTSPRDDDWESEGAPAVFDDGDWVPSNGLIQVPHMGGTQLGMDIEAAAYKILREYPEFRQLVVDIKYVDGVPGSVLKTEPKGGQFVQPGDTLTIYIGM